MIQKERYHLLDTLRGVAVVIMISYHTAWDLIYLFGVESDLLRSSFAGVYQSLGAWTFILLSGFCWSLGRNPLKHGLVCFGMGLLLTVVTLTIMPDNRILFGVLTLLGSCMLLMIPLDKGLKRVWPPLGLVVNTILFLFTKNINAASLGFGEWRMFTVPSWLYQNNLTAYLGFPQTGFHSTDYFSILPWFFLFCGGYFLYHCLETQLVEGSKLHAVLQQGVPALSFLGRHSLWIYVVHQPVIFGLLYIGMVIL